LGNGKRNEDRPEAAKRAATMHFIAGLLCAILLWQAEPVRAADATPAVPAAWLIRKISVEEAETEHPGINDERVQKFPDIVKPFGFENGEWEALKAQIQPGDEIWTFASPEDSWIHYAGRAGVALVRAGAPIKAIVTVMN
jgi:hypothetical protein